MEWGASEELQSHPHIYTSAMVPPPDDVQRVPKVESRYFNYKERNPTHPDFENWDTDGMTRYEVVLQNGSVATYVWFKLIEQPAMKTAQQNWPDVYTEDYLATVQATIEALHDKVAAHSTVNPPIRCSSIIGTRTTRAPRIPTSRVSIRRSSCSRRRAWRQAMYLSS